MGKKGRKWSIKKLKNHKGFLGLKHKEITKRKFHLIGIERQKKLWAKPYYKKMMSDAHKGYKQSKETIKKRVEQTLGDKHWNWNIHKIRNCIDCEVKITKGSKLHRCYKCSLKERKSRLTDEDRQLRRRIHQAKRVALRKSNGKCDFTLKEWKSILENSKHRCMICKIDNKKKKLTIDHIIPLSKGGEHTKSNIQPLCLSCNVRKYNKLLNES